MRFVANGIAKRKYFKNLFRKLFVRKFFTAQKYMCYRESLAGLNVHSSKENGPLCKKLIERLTSLTWPDLLLAKGVINTPAKVGGIYSTSDNALLRKGRMKLEANMKVLLMKSTTHAHMI